MHKYRLISRIDEDCEFDYLKAKVVKSGMLVNIKCMKKYFNSAVEVSNHREIQALRRLVGHPNIIRLLEVLYDEPNGRLALVFEAMGMNLHEAIKDRKDHVPEAKVQHWSYGIFKAVDHMHRNGIFHRHIKPEHVLLPLEDDGTDAIKLTGFGTCRGIYSRQPFTEYIATRWYRSPECLLTDGYYNFKTDIFATGCVMFEVIGLFPLFPGKTELEQIEKIHHILGTPDESLQEKLAKTWTSVTFPEQKGTGIRCLIPHANEKCLQLIEKCLAYDPDARILARQALKHPYFEESRREDKDLLKEAATTREFKELSTQDRFKKFHDAVAESEKIKRLQVRERFSTFDAWDKNEDGLIDMMEFARVLRELTTYFTSDRAKLLFEAADANKDGKIDLDEFLRFIFSQEPRAAEEDGIPNEQGEVLDGAHVCVKFDGKDYQVWNLEVPIAVIKGDMLSTFDLPDDAILSVKKEGVDVELSDEKTLAQEGVAPGQTLNAELIEAETSAKEDGIPNEQGERPDGEDVCIEFNGNDYQVWNLDVPIAVIKADIISTFDLPDDAILRLEKKGADVELSDEKTLAEEGIQPGTNILAQLIESQVRILFKKMEGILDLAEKKHMERIRSSFEEFDTSGEDTISEDEFAAILFHCGMPDEDARSCFAAADANADGVVKYNEFIDWIFKMPSAATDAASGGIKTVYHCTTKTACEGIVTDGFCFPTEADAHEKGLKLGAAICFGSDQEYCIREALKALAGDDPDDQKRVAATLGLIEARVQLGQALSLGNYGVDRFGLSTEEHKVFTEGLTKKHLNFFGYDTVTINEGFFMEEVAVYDSGSILELSIVDDPSLS